MARTTIQGSFLGLASQAAGDVMYFDGTNWIRLAKGSADEVLTMNNGATAPGWEVAGGGGATTREGGNTDGSGSYQTNSIEATTTSTSAVSLLSAASMSIATSSHLRIVEVGRKTSGHASPAAIGISMTTASGETIIREAVAFAYGGFLTSSTDRAENGGATIFFGTRSTNYTAMGLGTHVTKVSADGESVYASHLGSLMRDGLMPIATLTAITLRGISGNALVTLGADEFNIHSFSSS